MNDEKKSWLDRAGAVHLWKTIEAILGTKVDKIEGFGLSSNDYTTEEKNKLASLSDPNVATTENNGLMSSADKAKLDGIEAGANNYTHPVYEAKQAGLYRISVDNTGHVVTADKMTSEELTAEGQKLLESGIERVVISLGGRGALYLRKGSTIYAEGLKVPVGSTVGAGDSVVAALAYAESQDMSEEDAVRLSTATGAANVMCSGTQAAERSVIEELLPKVRFSKL